MAHEELPQYRTAAARDGYTERRRRGGLMCVPIDLEARVAHPAESRCFATLRVTIHRFRKGNMEHALAECAGG